MAGVYGIGILFVLLLLRFVWRVESCLMYHMLDFMTQRVTSLHHLVKADLSFYIPLKRKYSKVSIIHIHNGGAVFCS